MVSLFDFSAAEKSVRLHKMSILLDNRESTIYTPIIIAVREGYFKQHGIDLEIINETKPEEAMQSILDSKVHFAVSAQPDVVIAREKGLPIVSVVALIRYPYPLFDEYEKLKDQYGVVLVANDKDVHENILLYRSFMIALAKGHHFTEENIDIATHYMVDYENGKRSAQEVRTELEYVLSLMRSEDDTLFGSQSLSLWESLTETMLDKKYINHPIDPTKAFIDLRD